MFGRTDGRTDGGMKGRMDERMDGRTMRSGAVWGMAAPWACRLGIVWWLSENCLGLFEICLDVIMEMEMETEMEVEMTAGNLKGASMHFGSHSHSLRVGCSPHSSLVTHQAQTPLDGPAGPEPATEPVTDPIEVWRRGPSIGAAMVGPCFGGQHDAELCSGSGATGSSLNDVMLRHYIRTMTMRGCASSATC